MFKPCRGAVKIGFFGVVTFLDSPSPNWKTSSIYASMATSGKISLSFTGSNDYTYQTVSQKPISLNVSTTAPVVELFAFNPIWESYVLENKVLYLKYPLGGEQLRDNFTFKMIVYV